MQDYQQIKHCGVFVFAPRSVIFYTSQVFLHTQNVSQTMTIRARLFRERYLNLYLYVLHKALTAMLRQLRYWTIDWIFNLYFQNAQQDDKNKKTVDFPLPSNSEEIIFWYFYYTSYIK